MKLPVTLLGCCLLLGLSTLSYQAAAQLPTKLWDRTLGSTGDDQLSRVQPTADGGYIMGGFSGGGVSGQKTQASQGGYDYWVIKVDANGQKQWDRRFGGTSDDFLRDLRPTADGGYLLGGESTSGVSGDKTQASQGGPANAPDYWIVKLDASGQKQWDRSFGGSGYEYLHGVQQTADGGYIVGGQSDSPASGNKTQGSINADYWVVKLDATGQKQWDKTIGSASNDYLRSLQQTTDGGYVLAGYADAAVPSGDKSQPSRGGYDYWVVKLDAAGQKQWDRTVGGPTTEILNTVCQTADGGYMVAGTSQSGVGGDKTQPSVWGADYWIVKLDATGDVRWDRTFGSESHDDMTCVLPTADGGYLLGGFSSAGISGAKSQASIGNSYDYWLVKTNADGTKLWDRTYGGTDSDYLRTLLQTPAGDYLLGGYSYSPLSGDKTQPNVGNSAGDYWLVKISAGVPTATAASAAAVPWSLYPNPAQTFVTLQVPPGVPRQSLHLRLLDATGRVVYQQPLAVWPGAPVVVPLHAVPAGLYLASLEGAAGYRSSQRLVVE